MGRKGPMMQLTVTASSSAIHRVEEAFLPYCQCGGGEDDYDSILYISEGSCAQLQMCIMCRFVLSRAYERRGCKECRWCRRCKWRKWRRARKGRMGRKGDGAARVKQAYHVDTISRCRQSDRRRKLLVRKGRFRHRHLGEIRGQFSLNCLFDFPLEKE